MTMNTLNNKEDQMTKQEADAIMIEESERLSEELGGPLGEVYMRIAECIRNGTNTSFAYRQRLRYLMTGEEVPLLHKY